ncbi:uncharacterized protein LOC134251842 [Saccostrea cucullata]|uniref:uncharacterized protein LOC134251842 n=1 Tax=Saccostrea cuccullata TaxID=36930 RepID=UPI002ED5A2B9
MMYLCAKFIIIVKFYGFTQFFILLYSVSSSIELTGKHVCGSKENETYCCKNYEERNNMCVECRSGFFGDNCSLTCPKNHYGPRCKFECNCDKSEYCHRVCGCVSNLTKAFEEKQKINNVTSKHGTKDTDITQSFLMESCLSSTKKSIESTVNNVGKSNDEVFNLDDNKVLTVFLVVLPSVLFVCLLLFFGITCRKYHTKKNEVNDGVHNELYINQEGNRVNNTLSREDTSEDPLRGSCEDPCYSTLTLRVNYGPIQSCNQNESSEDVNPYGYTYEGEGNVARVQGRKDNNIYLDKESVGTHMSSTQGQYEDPWRNDCNNSLLRHSSQRRFDLMPVNESYSALRGKEYGPYELASSN